MGFRELDGLRLLLVGVVGSIVLQVLVEEAVRLRYEEHQLVEHFANDVLPVLLVSLLLGFSLRGVLNASHHQ